MRIIIWGLGYVGTVSAACLAQLGHEVIGVEPHLTKVEALNAGHSVIKEPGLDHLVSQMVKTGRLRATQDGVPLVPWADISLICVGTPAATDGSPMLEYVRNVAMDIGRGLRATTHYQVIVLRSTVFPGTMRQVLIQLCEEYSGRQAGRDFGLVMNPEFMRETNAISDFYTPPYTIIGELDHRSGDRIAELYQDIQAPIYRVSLEEAELLKLANNAFHALKIGFANEMGRLCGQVHIDSHAIMQMVCADTKLNISSAYLKPGFAFGGSCLPKDLRSLTFNARRLGVELPILEAVLPSNRLQIEAARLKVHELGAQCVAVLGLSFKPNTDDLRESPIIGLVRDLWQDGLDVLVYDPDVQPETMLGSNREYLERQLPQIHQILCPHITEALPTCHVVIVSQKRPEFTAVLQALPDHTTVLDLVRLHDDPAALGVSRYRGIAW
ncbi:MAG: nucleotide sugar dehydrogenase [Candidatus Tectimicrobiota bacterium]